MSRETPIPPPVSQVEQLPQVIVDRIPDLTGPSEARRDFVVDPRRVSIPRSVVYWNAVLLVLLTLGCSLLGFLVGQSVERRRGVVVDDSSPRMITGRVTYLAESGERLPDVGAALFVVPEEERPQMSDKIQTAGLQSVEVGLDSRHPELMKLHQWGGGYARADESGNFQLRVARPGRYFVLALSRAGRRASDAELSRTELSQMSRLFDSPQGLVSDRRYRWLNESIVRDRRLVIELE